MQKDLQGLRIGGHDDEIGNAAVERLGGLVGALFQLLVVGGLLDQIEDGDRQIRVCKGIGFGVDFTHDASLFRITGNACGCVVVATGSA